VDQQEQSRWRPTRRQVLWTVGIVVAVVVAFIFLGYVREWRWTGFVGDKDFSKKTLWDWLELLIVPVVLALGGYLFARSENSRTQKIAEEQRTLDREIADEQRQDDVLQAYLEGVSQLLTDKDQPLHRAQLRDSLSMVARARTLTVLTRLDGKRKASVVQFLYESGLIIKNQLVVVLRDADLSEADLNGTYLSEADLNGANLSEALLSDVNLSRADLSEADLRGAKLSGADLNEARTDLSEANLSRADLHGANLHGAKLFGAHYLSKASLSSAELSDVNLSRANLNGSNLRAADLSEANLNGANLSGADLTGADLSNANLSVANLSVATGWTKEQLTTARSLEGATMPNGQKYEDWLKDKEGAGEDGETSGPP